ncbi:MAG: TetR/AcrR family transcriptional regulator [Proteobacteria bacterium]|nr:TetR/AcrR family transcriptional regulator [Pseudomonadota bacterium]
MAKREKRGDKGRISRDNIMKAARRLFSEHPYNAASLRMIGKEGGFEHPLIHYYFPTKAALFEAVLADIGMEIYKANLSWFEGLVGLPPLEALEIHIDRILKFNRKSPEPFRILFLNMAEIQQAEEMPGFALIPGIIAGVKANLEERFTLSATDEEVGMLTYGFSVALITYLGASYCHGMVLGMDPESEEYWKWVKKNLIFLFGPVLEKMNLGPAATSPPK